MIILEIVPFSSVALKFQYFLTARSLFECFSSAEGLKISDTVSEGREKLYLMRNFP